MAVKYFNYKSENYGEKKLYRINPRTQAEISIHGVRMWLSNMSLFLH